jgi:hypothetical protein
MSGHHFAKAGPLYWDFKCIKCGEDMKGHFTRNLIALIKEEK